MNTEVTTAQMNRAICEFIGWEFRPDGEDWFKAYHKGELMWAASDKELIKILLEGFKFHEDWNKLMQVVEKIPPLIHATDDMQMRRQMSGRYKPIENEMCNFNIINTHYCLYQFIIWYNQQKQTNETKQQDRI